MPFKDPSLLLRHIIDSVGMIEEFTAGMNFDAFRQDPKTIAAVERKLLTISEAGKRLGDQAEVICPEVPWHKVRAIGNWLRHAYDRIDLDQVWRTVTDDLPSLKTAVTAALERIKEPERREPA